MGNYIKIPLAINPPRSFRSTSITIAGSRLSGGGTIVAGTASAAAATTVAPAGGSGATFSMASSGTAIANVTLTCAAIGEGYKVGDVITVAAIPADTGKGSATAAMTFTVTAADLVVSEGSATNDYQLIDVNSYLTSDGFAGKIIIYQKIVPFEGGVLCQKINLILDNSPTPDYGVALRNLSDAVIKAIQAPNSLPIVDWAGSVEVLSVIQD